MNLCFFILSILKLQLIFNEATFFFFNALGCPPVPQSDSAIWYEFTKYTVKCLECGQSLWSGRFPSLRTVRPWQMCDLSQWLSVLVVSGTSAAAEKHSHLVAWRVLHRLSQNFSVIWEGKGREYHQISILSQVACLPWAGGNPGGKSCILHPCLGHSEHIKGSEKSRRRSDALPRITQSYFRLRW